MKTGRASSMPPTMTELDAVRVKCGSGAALVLAGGCSYPRMASAKNVPRTMMRTAMYAA